MDRTEVPVPLTVCEPCSLALSRPVRIAKSDSIAHAERHARAQAFAESVSLPNARASITGPVSYGPFDE